MKFTEKSVVLETDSLFHFIRSIVVLVLFAPYRLISEISLRIVFLEKKTITSILFLSMIYCVSLTIIMTVIQFLFEIPSITLGTLPIVFFLIADVILFILYYCYKTYGFVLYDHLKLAFDQDALNRDLGDEMVNSNTDPESTSSVKTRSNSEVENTSKVLKELNSSTSDMPETVKISAKPDEEGAIPSTVDTTKDSLCNESQDLTVQELQHEENIKSNPIVFNSQDVRNFQNRFKNVISQLENHSKEQVQDFDMELITSELDSCTDPSKFIDENMIAMFADTNIGENLDFLDGIDLGVIPESFNMLV